MKTLVVDTTTDDLVVALLDGNAVTSTILPGNRGKTCQTLCEAASLTLQKAQTSFDDLDAFAVAVGPGSFTGIRIGISTVKGWNVALAKPVVAFCNLEALCLGNGSAKIDAGNGWYWAEYQDGNVVAEPQLVPYDDVRAANAYAYTTAEEHLACDVAVVRDKLAKGAFVDVVSPVYVRKSQAEERSC